jgi:hypothetical protein
MLVLQGTPEACFSADQVVPQSGGHLGGKTPLEVPNTSLEQPSYLVEEGGKYRK